MGVRRDLRKARRRADLRTRTRLDLVRDENGVVREARTAPLADPLTTGSLADLPYTNAAEAPTAVILKRRTAQGTWLPVTAAEFAAEVTATAKGLIAAGVEPGSRVALMSRTRYEWTVLDFAIWAAGGVTVPVYPTSSADQVEWIVRDSGARHVVTENPANTATVVKATAARAPKLWELDGSALADLRELGRGVPDEQVERRRRELTPDATATICYTSGTTGRPKGCVLTHANLHAEAGNVLALLHPVFEAVTGAGAGASTLLFLPLAHIMGRTLQIACLTARIGTGHFPSVRPDELRPALREFRPTFLVGVPYLFERIHDTGRATAEKLGRAASFDRAENVGVRYAEAYFRKFLGQGKGPGLALTAAHTLYDVLVFRRIRKELGGRLHYAISGGSPLDRTLNLFFQAAGIVVYEGYGLTETSAAATLAPPLEPRPGTVGRPVPGTAIRIADDGEVQISGQVVFHAYWNDPRATQEVLKDGWFSTGDLGSLDGDGYLTITGRKKDLLVTSGGKNVSPAVLEDRLRSRSPVGQCLVVGDNRPFVAALVTLDPDAVTHWLTVQKLPPDTPLADVLADPRIQDAVQRAVTYANQAVSRAESIRAFRLVEGQFTEENGLLTPSLKVRRQAAAEVYAADIEALYRK